MTSFQRTVAEFKEITAGYKAMKKRGTKKYKEKMKKQGLVCTDKQYSSYEKPTLTQSMQESLKVIEEFNPKKKQ